MLAFEYSAPVAPDFVFGLAQDGTPEKRPPECPPCPAPLPLEPRKPVAGAWLAASFIALGLITYVVVQTMRGRLL
jgi:hypothetical protein